MLFEKIESAVLLHKYKSEEKDFYSIWDCVWV